MQEKKIFAVTKGSPTAGMSLHSVWKRVHDALSEVDRIQNEPGALEYVFEVRWVVLNELDGIIEGEEVDELDLEDHGAFGRRLLADDGRPLDIDQVFCVTEKSGISLSVMCYSIWTDEQKANEEARRLKVERGKIFNHTYMVEKFTVSEQQ